MTDTATFVRLCRTWWGGVRDAAFRALGDLDDAEDAAQRVFVRLWSGGGWSRIADPSRYFPAAGRREAFATLRRRGRRRRAWQEGCAAQAWPAWVPTPEDALLHAEWRRTAAQAIGRLPPRCGLACMLVLLEGLTHAEAAERMGISAAAVEKQIARARRRLAAEGTLRGLDPMSTFEDGGGSPARASQGCGRAARLPAARG